MKPLTIPLTLLAAILLFSLWSGSQTHRLTQEWIAHLEEADLCAQAENWSESSRSLRKAYAAWHRNDLLLHTLLSHTELDDAESLFSASFAACDVRDVPDFHASVAQLAAKLYLLAETQQFSLGNIL